MKSLKKQKYKVSKAFLNRIFEQSQFRCFPQIAQLLSFLGRAAYLIALLGESLINPHAHRAQWWILPVFCPLDSL